jgi:hypothetical protein
MKTLIEVDRKLWGLVKYLSTLEDKNVDQIVNRLLTIGLEEIAKNDKFIREQLKN